MHMYIYIYIYIYIGIDPPRKVDEPLEDLVAKACVAIGNHPDDVFRLKVYTYICIIKINIYAYIYICI
jgi:hypothetical protein